MSPSARQIDDRSAAGGGRTRSDAGDRGGAGAGGRRRRPGGQRRARRRPRRLAAAPRSRHGPRLVARLPLSGRHQGAVVAALLLLHSGSAVVVSPGFSFLGFDWLLFVSSVATVVDFLDEVTWLVYVARFVVDFLVELDLE